MIVTQSLLENQSVSSEGYTAPHNVQILLAQDGPVESPGGGTPELTAASQNNL